MDLSTYNESNFTQDVLQSTKPVLVIFSAVWCGPCRSAKISMEHVASEHRTYVQVGVVDIDDNPNLAIEYNIKGVPTIFMFHNGVVADRFSGTATKIYLSKWVEEYLRAQKIL